MKNQIFCVLVLISSLLFSQNGLLGTDKECKKGLVKTYHDNGKLWYTGVNSKDCYEIGEWKEYYDNGRLKELLNYNNKGDEDGKYEYYFENGRLQESGYYTKGDEKGLWIRYYENGQLEQKANYKNGQKSGDYISYFENGNISYEGAYKDGLKKGLHKSYYPSGGLLSQINYKEGEVSGQEDYYDNKGKLLPPNQTIAYEDDYYTILDKSFKVNGKEIRDYMGNGKPTEYYYNGQIKAEYELKDDYYIRKAYYQNGNIEIISNAIYNNDYDSYVKLSGQRVGITKEYDEQGNFIKETDEDFELAQKQMTWASEDAKYREYRYKNAHELFLKSAQRGNKEAEKFLGYMYHMGLGVSVNYEIAKEWYAKSCDKNVYNSCYNISVIILDKENVIVNQMNALGSSEAENKKYDELRKELIDTYKESLPYAEKAYSIDNSDSELKQLILNIKNAINAN